MLQSDVWAIYLYDPAIKERRLAGVYYSADDAHTDCQALTNETQQPTIELFTIYTEAQYASHDPAIEEGAVDFDTPIHMNGEVR